MEQVSTAASSIEMKHNYSVFPGQKLKLKFTLKDDFNRSISGTSLHFRTERQSFVSLSLNDTLILRGAEGDIVDIRITAVHIPHISECFTVNLTDCPFGYKINETSEVCECVVGAEGRKLRSSSM